MTTKKKTTKSSTTTKKAAAPKAEAKSTKTTKTTKAAAAVATVETVETAVEVKENLTVTMAPEAPATAEAPVEIETVVAAAPAPEATKPVLTIGMLQKRLSELGYYQGWYDGIYGPLTKQAVGHFQWKNGIYADGNATPETLKALGF